MPTANDGLMLTWYPIDISVLKAKQKDKQTKRTTRKEIIMKRNYTSTTLLTLALLLVTIVSGRTQTTRYQFPDGSGSISLAPDWKIINAGNGAVSAKSGDSAIVLGMPVPVVSRNVVAQFPGIPSAALFPGSPRVDFSNPARAAIDMMLYMNRKSPGAAKNIKIQAVEYVQMEKGKAAFIRYSVTTNGVPTEAFGLYTIMPIDATQGLFFYSTVCASKDNYNQTLPTMMAMWHSWTLSDSIIRKRLQDAATALAQVDVVGTMSEVNAHRRKVAEDAAAAFDAYLRQ